MLGRLFPSAIFLAAALASAAVFLITLHPLSGSLGGMVAWLAGWALPSLCVVLLALAIACLLPVSWLWRALAALILSFPIGLNTALPTVAEAFGYQARTSQDVRRMATWHDPYNSVTVQKRPWGAVFTLPFGPHVRVGGDEGCMCFYFRDAEHSLYSERVIDTLFAAVGRRGGVLDYDNAAPGQKDRDVHIDLRIWDEETALRALIEVFDRGEKIAAFAHTNIPKRLLVQPAGIGRDKFKDNFWSNALDLLAHDNIWSKRLNPVTGDYFPHDDIARFFADVFPLLGEKK